MQARRFGSVCELPARYDAAFEQAARRTPFLSRPWLENFQRTVVAPGEATPVFAVESAQAEQACGVLPCWKPGANQPGTTAQLQGLCNYYASLFGPVLPWPSVHGEALVDALVQALVRAPEASPRVRLAPLPADDGQLDALERAFRRHGWWTRRFFCFGNWYLPSRDLSYASFLDQRPAALRNTLRRRQRQFDRLPEARLELITGGADLERGLAAYRRVYALSWKQPEPYGEFIPGLVRALAGEGWLRLGVAWMGDRPVAAQIWVVGHGVASIYKLAYDSRLRNLSAGTLLTGMLLRHVLDEERVREVDYLTGDERYKRDWMSHRRERWGLAAFDPRTVSGFLAGAGNLASQWGQQLWRRAWPPNPIRD